MTHLNQECAVKDCKNKAGDVDDSLYLTDYHGWVCGPCLPEVQAEEGEYEADLPEEEWNGKDW